MVAEVAKERKRFESCGVTLFVLLPYSNEPVYLRSINNRQIGVATSFQLPPLLPLSDSSLTGRARQVQTSKRCIASSSATMARTTESQLHPNVMSNGLTRKSCPDSNPLCINHSLSRFSTQVQYLKTPTGAQHFHLTAIQVAEL